jgi:hypothetical protein
MVAMGDQAFGAKILPCAIQCLTSKNNDLVQAASGILSIISMKNKTAVAENIPQILDALEAGVPDMAASTLLSTIYTVYDRNRDDVHAHIDTIAEYAVTGSMARSGASQVLSKVAKRAPRLLYGFIDELIPLLDDSMSAAMILFTLSDVAARNALVVRPHLRKIKQAAEEFTGGLYYGASALGRIGRVDPEAAREAQDALCGWLRDDIDPQATASIVVEVRNVGGVYKDSLTPHMSVIRNLTTHSDSKVVEVCNKIVSFYDGNDQYVAETFLTNQEDVFGRLLKVVDTMVDQKTSGLTKSIEELSRRADHQEAALTAQQEEVLVLSDNVTKIGDRVNVVEAAAVHLSQRVDAVEESLDELQAVVEKNDAEIKLFVGEIVKKLPVPDSFEAKGTIRKRVILRFKCSRGTEPDFVYETASWSKWLRVGVCALQVGKNVAIGDVGGTLQGMVDLFKSVRRKDVDAELTFKTLVEQPFLTAAEEDELITNLRSNGFFDQFEYDAMNGTWYRMEARDVKPEGGKGVGKDTKSTVSLTAAATRPPADCSGWVTKIGGRIRSKKRRWLELRDRTLYYYVEESALTLKGEIPVSKIALVTDLDADMWFTLVTPNLHNGEYRFQVDTPTEYTMWKTAIEAARQ